MTTPTPPGWYDDPNDPGGERFWDGRDWAPNRRRKPSESAGQPFSSSIPPQQPASPGYPPQQPASPGYPPASYPPPVTVQQPSNPASPGPGWWQASDGNWYPPQDGAGAPGTPSATVGIGEAFSYGLAKFQVNAREILIAGGICLLSYAVLIGVTWLIVTTTLFSGAFLKEGGVALFLIALPLVFLVPLVAFWLIQMVIIRGSLSIVNGQTPLVLGRMFSADGIGSFAVGAVLVSVATVIGFMLCYIPGIIFLFFAGYWAYFQIGKQLSPVDAIRASFNLVWANLGTQLIFAFASFLIYWLGSLVCYFGLIVALPVIIIAQGYMWRRLQGEPVAP